MAAHDSNQNPHDDSSSEVVVLGLSDDPIGEGIVREELKLLAMVQRALAVAARARLDETKERDLDDQRLLELREDISVAKPDDLPALFEQMHHLGAIRSQRGKSLVGSMDRSSPYFGHLRLDENGKRREVLIGARSYVDPKAGVRIVDWRNAPVSRIFYRYREADDYEEELGDRTVDGTVVARRSVAIVGGVLMRVSAPQGTFMRHEGDTWTRADQRVARLQTEKRAPHRLGAGQETEIRGDKHLSALAAQLDPAQFDLIARPGGNLVVVQGSAGSGKTTVGLHRIAYLAFSDPARFRPETMLVVVPHDGLVHYVARVLPSLGVGDVPVTTFTRQSTRWLRRMLPKLPTLLHDNTPPIVIRAKTHPAMLRAIDAAQRQIERQVDERINAGMRAWAQGGTVVAAWAATGTSGAAVDVRLTALAQWIVGKRTLDGIFSASSLPESTRGAVERMGHQLRSFVRDVARVWDEILTDRDELAKTFDGLEGFGPGQLDQVHAWCVRQSRIRTDVGRDGETASIDAEDTALLLRIWQQLRGPLQDDDGKPLRMSHVFVDEVQDENPIALRVLMDLTGKAPSITLAGDGAQKMTDEGDTAGEFDWKELLADLDVPNATLEPLRVSYRSTQPITTFAQSVLGPYAHSAEPIATRPGPPVELFEFASTGEAVAFVADALKQLAQDEPDANVALVTRFGPQADAYYAGLERAEVPRLRRVDQQDFRWEPGFDVTDIRQTKGLEFDEVILLDANASSYPDSAPARHALYVGATRAAHQLWCVASDKPSTVITAALNESAARAPTDS